MTPKLIIFDFDGVIADSELLANAVLAEVMSELGAPMTTEQAIAAFMGKRFEDVITTIETLTGRSAPTSLADDFQARTLDRFKRDLKEISGVREFLDAFAGEKRCIASSSSPDRLALCLEILKLKGHFGPHVFSASQVARGKPHPDIFLFAAGQMNVAPTDSLVIEDSASGVRGAVAAGMTAIGLLAGSHIGRGHEDQLRGAGARHIARSYPEAEAIARAWLA